MSDTEWYPRNVGLHNTATQLRAVYIQISLQHQHNNNLFITCLLGTDAFTYTVTVLATTAVWL